MRHPKTSVVEHDYRCQGECISCHGAEACGMVGLSCIPCTGQCATRRHAITDTMIDRAAAALSKKLHWLNDSDRARELAVAALDAAHRP